MKIAVPSNDGVSLSPHFGHAAAFLVFEVEDDLICGFKVIRHAPAEQVHAGCGSQGQDQDSDHTHENCRGHEGEEAGHSHAGILSALRECELVICHGIGSHAARDLQAQGIRTLPTAFQGPAEEAVRLYLAGSLPAGGDFCGCHG